MFLQVIIEHRVCAEEAPVLRAAATPPVESTACALRKLQCYELRQLLQWKALRVHRWGFTAASCGDSPGGKQLSRPSCCYSCCNVPCNNKLKQYNFRKFYLKKNIQKFSKWYTVQFIIIWLKSIVPRNQNRKPLSSLKDLLIFRKVQYHIDYLYG